MCSLGMSNCLRLSYRMVLDSILLRAGVNRAVEVLLDKSVQDGSQIRHFVLGLLLSVAEREPAGWSRKL